MKNTIITLIIFLVTTFSCLFSQRAVLEESLKGISDFNQVMQIVEAHYNDIESGRRDRLDEPKFKHWVRWAYYMSSRLGENGELVDVRAYNNKAAHKLRSDQRTPLGNWSFVGPYSISGGASGSGVGIGRVDRIAFHPTNPNIMYIGTPAAGIMKTTNGGASWYGLTDNLPSVGVSGIVVSNDDPNKIFILTGDGDTDIGGFVENFGYMRSSAGCYVSYDAGINWYALAPLPITGSYVGYRLVQDPNNPNVLMAATSAGLYRTNNSGASWTQVISGRTYDIRYKPFSSTTCYATKSGQFFYSNDNGVTWNSNATFDVSISGSSRITIGVCNDLESWVYLLVGPGNMGAFRGLYLSTNNGQSFTQRSNSPNILGSACDGTGGSDQSNYDLALGVSHLNGFRLISGAIRVYRSINGGVTWNNAYPSCEESSSTGFIHADTHEILYNPINDWAYAVGDGGVYRTTDHGESWVSLSTGVTASQIYHMAGSNDDYDNIMIGLQDNGTKMRTSNSSTFNQVLSADGFDCIFDDDNATKGYGSYNKTVFKFWDTGSNWTGITPDGVDEWFPRVTVSVSDGDLVLAGFSDIYKSTDAGGSWNNEGAAGNWDLEHCPSNSSKFYAAGGSSAWSTSGNMYRSTNSGDSWTTISNNTGYPSGNIRLTDIDVRPTNSNNVWIVFGGFSDGKKVYYSSSSGSSWTNMSGSLPNIPINAIAIDAGNNAYIGTDIGMFYRGSTMSDWIPFSHGLPRVPVTDLELYEPQGKIRAATFGKGVWVSPLYNTCSTYQYVVGNVYGQKMYEANEYVITTAVVYGGENTDVTLKAEEYVRFLPGFNIGVGNRLHAYTAPCGVAQIDEE